MASDIPSTAMTHPQLLEKSMTEITAATRALIENLYNGNPSKCADDVWIRYHQACGMMMLWSEICIDMVPTSVINVADQNDLQSLIMQLDGKDRERLGMPKAHI